MTDKATHEPEHTSHKKKSPVSKKPAPKPTPAPTPTPTPTSGTATYTLITMPDDGLTALYNLLSSATKSIDMTMYELTDTTVTSILTKAAAAGIAVRVILDQNNEKQANTTAYNTLAAGGVAVHWANPAYAVTHQKTITVDSATSAIMTLNLTTEDYPMTRDFAVITNDAADVAAIETTFNADFTNATITPPTGDNLVWSPTNSSAALLGIINGATTSLLIAQEEMDDTDIESALEAALKRGVALTLVQENMSGSYTSILQTFKADGAKVATYSSKTGYYIHAKAILADYGTAAAKLFLGPENFSNTSLTENRELGLIFNDAACMAGVEAAITKDYDNGNQLVVDTHWRVFGSGADSVAAVE
jgi:cardiolipin synthase A/B